MILRPGSEWRDAEHVLQLRVLAAFAWLMVCAGSCALGDEPGRFASLDAAAAWLTVAGALFGLSYWSKTVHQAGSFAALVLFDAPALAAIQAFGVPFAPGSPTVVAVSVWFFAYLLLAGALTRNVLAVSVLALEGLLLQGWLMAAGHLPDELIGVTLAVFAALAGLAVPVTRQLMRAAESASGD